MKPRKLTAALVMLLLISTFAKAELDVTIGHHTWAADGLPQIGPGEQATAFVCNGPASWKRDKDIFIGSHGNEELLFEPSGTRNWPCSLLRCLKALTGSIPGGEELFEIAYAPFGRDKKKKIHSGKCLYRGIVGNNEFTHSVVMIGPKGDNTNILAQAINMPTRALAIKQIADTGFPVEKGTFVIDYWNESYDRLSSKRKWYKEKHGIDTEW